MAEKIRIFTVKAGLPTVEEARALAKITVRSRHRVQSTSTASWGLMA